MADPAPSSRPNSRYLKRLVHQTLQANDFEEQLPGLCTYPARRVINPLFSCLLSTEALIKWRAVTAMGVVCACLAETDMESARVIMRRLMWSLNDESGGIGWGAPEAMAEIMAGHQGLAAEYADVLISYIREDGNFLEYEPLQQGALWAIGRAAQTRNALFQPAGPYLVPFLRSADSALRGLAAWALGMLRFKDAAAQLARLLNDPAEITIYLDRRLVRRSVAALAQEALAACQAPGAAVH